jgi:hypothetical protein
MKHVTQTLLLLAAWLIPSPCAVAQSVTGAQALRRAPGPKLLPADLVLLNGGIYTVDPELPWAQAAAVRKGRIVFVGSNAQIQPYVGPNTQVVDLTGRVAMPGFHDTHVHILEALHPAYSCFLPPGQTLPSYVPILQACASGQPGPGWLLGYGHSIYDVQLHLNGGGVAPVDLLDQAVSNRPTAILEETSHSVWANSQALAAAGIDASTPDPVGGVILRKPNGAPNGILLDAAGELVMDAAFEGNQAFEDLNYQALLAGLALAAQNGITSLCDARTY